MSKQKNKTRSADGDEFEIWKLKKNCFNQLVINWLTDTHRESNHHHFQRKKNYHKKDSEQQQQQQTIDDRWDLTLSIFRIFICYIHTQICSERTAKKQIDIPWYKRRRRKKNPMIMMMIRMTLISIFCCCCYVCCFCWLTFENFVKWMMMMMMIITCWWWSIIIIIMMAKLGENLSPYLKKMKKKSIFFLFQVRRQS